MVTNSATASSNAYQILMEGFVNIVYAMLRLWYVSELIIGLGPANERRRYFVTTSLTGWLQSCWFTVWWENPVFICGRYWTARRAWSPGQYLSHSGILEMSQPRSITTLRLRQNGWHFADDIFQRVFFNENRCIWIEISLKFVPEGPIKISQH